MSKEIETTLRRALDAADRRRRQLTWLLAIAGLTITWEFYRLAQIAQVGDVPRMIVSAVMVLFFSILGLAVLFVFQLTIATRRVLRAIELASASTGTSR